MNPLRNIFIAHYQVRVPFAVFAPTLAPRETRDGHANYAFTQPGLYELTIEATGTHNADGLITSSATYQFAVATPVPEPTTGM